MNPQNLLEQFLGAGTAQAAGSAISGAREKIAGSGMGATAGGLVAGGLLGVVLGNKKMRKKAGKLAGGAVGYGGAAALGALALRAYQNWQTGAGAGAGAEAAPARPARDNTADNTAGSVPSPAASALPPATPVAGALPAADGRPFELALVLAMIAAANADGHIDAEEQKRVFERVGNAGLDAEAKGFVFDALSRPPGLADIAALAGNQEQGVEIYLASRLAIDPDHPMERAYLEALAARLALPPELAAHLDAEAAALEAV